MARTMIMCPICMTVAGTCRPGNLGSCRRCNHIFQIPLKSTIEYNYSYVRSRYDSYSTTDLMSYLRLGFVRAYVDGGTLLDVGYGNGAFLKAAQQAGFETYGHDVHGADYGVRNISLGGNKDWDVVTFFDSLEHCESFDLVLKTVEKASFVIVSLPWRPDWFPDSLDWNHYRPGEHLHYFSVKSVEHLFKDHHIVKVTDLEDVIRRVPGQRNVMTLTFARRRPGPRGS